MVSQLSVVEQPAQREGEALHKSLPWKSIGKSTLGRDLRVYFNRVSEIRCDQPRVLIIAAQHGDEPISCQAATEFLRGASVEGVQLAVLSSANPDGATAGERRNASGIDLNRDHQDLEAPETRAIHRFARDWRPDLIIDAHTFPARRKVMLRQGVSYLQDVQLDVANNPAIAEPVRQTGESLLQYLLHEFECLPFEIGRYLLFRKDGRVRHSTPDVVDARNGLALRLGIPALLIEGRQPSRHDRTDRTECTRAAMVAAMEKAVEWARENSGCLRSLRNSAQGPGDRLAVRAKLLSLNENRNVRLADSETGEPTTFPLGSNFTPHIEGTRRVRLPAAYGIHKSNQLLLERLARHGYESTSWSAGSAECFTLLSESGPNDKVNRPKKSCSKWKRTSMPNCDLSEFVVFPLRQCGGTSLAAHVDPRAKYSLSRGLQSELPPQILRIF